MIVDNYHIQNLNHVINNINYEKILIYLCKNDLKNEFLLYIYFKGNDFQLLLSIKNI